LEGLGVDGLEIVEVVGEEGEEEGVVFGFAGAFDAPGLAVDV